MPPSAMTPPVFVRLVRVGTSGDEQLQDVTMAILRSHD
jgi:hypothetical protein